MKIGIIAAMPEEASAILRGASSALRETIATRSCHRFIQNHHEILVIQAGMGFDNAARSAEALIDCFAPELLVSAGFCGGIAPELQVGDMVVACGFTIVSGTATEEVPIALPVFTRQLVKTLGDQGKRVFESNFVSTPSVMNKVDISGLLPRHVRFPVVEMESAAIALIAVERKVAYCAIRTVSDPRSEELQFSIEDFCDSQKNISIPRVLFTIAKRPRILPQLIRLAGNSRVAAQALTYSIQTLLTTVH